MSGVILVGSGEFTPAMADADIYLMSCLPKNPKVAILPTAAGKEHDYAKWIDRGVSHFKEFGANVFGVHLITRNDARDSSKLKELGSADLIYLSGGDPGYLLSVIKDSPVEELIKGKLKVPNFMLAGASAGAMFLGQWLPANIYAMMNSDQMANWEEALAVVPYTVLPHYDFVLREHKQLADSLLSTVPASAKKHLIGIDEDTALVVGSKQVIGRGKVRFLG